MVRQPTITLAMWQSEVIAPAMQAAKPPDEILGVDLGDRMSVWTSGTSSRCTTCSIRGRGAATSTGSRRRWPRPGWPGRGRIVQRASINVVFGVLLLLQGTGLL